MYGINILENIKCSSEEKVKILNTIDNLLGYSENVRKFGIFFLEQEIKRLDDRFMKKALQMMVDGVEPEMIKKILLNYILCSSNNPAGRLEKLIILEGILDIQKGLNRWLIREKLISFLGEDMIERVENHYELDNHSLIAKLNNYLAGMDQKHHKNYSDFGKTIQKMNERSLQRLLREIDVDTLAEAICRETIDTVKKILNNVSIRVSSNLIQQLEEQMEESSMIIEGAQDYILKVMHQLLNDDELTI